MKGRTVLYTGAAGGLGLDTTLLLIERGATVVAIDYDLAKVARLEEAARMRGLPVHSSPGAGGERPKAVEGYSPLPAPLADTTPPPPLRGGPPPPPGEELWGRLIVSTADLADLPGFRAVLDALIAETGGFDIVVNNAAIYPSKPFEDYSIEEHQAVQRVNVDAGIVAVQAALPGMRARGFGRIVNVSSITLSGGWANLSPYVASKMALVGLTRAWAREFGSWGVTVNAIAPGAFPTDAEKIHPDPEGYNRMVLDAQSIKRRGNAHDIANAIAFFASDESGFITGQTLHVNGGWYMA